MKPRLCPPCRRGEHGLHQIDYLGRYPLVLAALTLCRCPECVAKTERLTGIRLVPDKLERSTE